MNTEQTNNVTELNTDANTEAQLSNSRTLDHAKEQRDCKAIAKGFEGWTSKAREKATAYVLYAVETNNLDPLRYLFVNLPSAYQGKLNSWLTSVLPVKRVTKVDPKTKAKSTSFKIDKVARKEAGGFHILNSEAFDTPFDSFKRVNAKKTIEELTKAIAALQKRFDRDLSFIEEQSEEFPETFSKVQEIMGKAIKECTTLWTASKGIEAPDMVQELRKRNQGTQSGMDTQATDKDAA